MMTRRAAAPSLALPLVVGHSALDFQDESLHRKGRLNSLCHQFWIEQVADVTVPHDRQHSQRLHLLDESACRFFNDALTLAAEKEGCAASETRQFLCTWQKTVEALAFPNELGKRREMRLPKWTRPEALYGEGRHLSDCLMREYKCFVALAAAKQVLHRLQLWPAHGSAEGTGRFIKNE